MAKTEKKDSKPRNYVLGGGVMRFSRSRMYKKRAIYRKKKADQKKTVARKPAVEYITKTIGGEKNGGSRKVPVKRSPRNIDTEQAPQKFKNRKKCFSEHRRRLRASITPGTVLIVVAGRHKGKRVVFLKQLDSGLLLVTGPYKLNSCPLRRINQIYVIATQAKIDISGVKLPERVNDNYFKRKALKKPKQQEGEIFETKKEVYTVSDERKEDQIAVDKQVLDAIRKHEKRHLLFGYLGSMFSLRTRDYPHTMKF